MQQPLLSASVLRDDGARGTIVGSDTPGQFIVKFDDGTSLPVAPDALVRQADGSYRLTKSAAGPIGDVRRIWEAKNPGTWEENKAVAHYAWEKVRNTR